MPRMIRKQIYIRKRQQAALTRLARARGTSEAEVIRQALEVRNKAFATPEFFALLKQYNVALVTADTADWPWYDQTADFTYCRLQGAPGAERYEPAEIDAWAKRFSDLSSGKALKDGPFIVPMEGKQPERDAFVYFVSTDKPNAPGNALKLMEKLKLTAETD